MSNYTKEQEAVLEQAQPITFDGAVDLAAEFGKTPRSVIAKAKNMGLDYIPREPVHKRPTQKTKAEVVAEIAAALEVDASDFTGLEKATVAALVNLSKSV